jgi:hypothetical protein
LRSLPWKSALLAGAALALTACGGSSSTPITSHQVTISWAANHEKGVNRAGGGYRVSIPGKPIIDVPFLSGAASPTSVETTLTTGSYAVTVSAYALLDANGGSTGSQSPPSQAYVINVP